MLSYWKQSFSNATVLVDQACAPSSFLMLLAQMRCVLIKDKERLNSLLRLPSFELCSNS